MLSLVEVLEVSIEAIFYFKSKSKTYPENIECQDREMQSEEKKSINEIIYEDRANTPKEFF